MEGRKNSTNISDWKRVCRVVGSTQIMASPAPGVAACIGLHVSIWPSSKFSTEGNSWTDQHWLNKRAPDLVSGHPPRILEAMKVDYTPVFHPLCQYVDWQFNLDTRQVTSWFYRNFTSFKWNRLIERAASRGWLHDLHFAVSTFCVTSALEVEHQSCEFILRIKPNVNSGTQDKRNAFVQSRQALLELLKCTTWSFATKHRSSSRTSNFSCWLPHPCVTPFRVASSRSARLPHTALCVPALQNPDWFQSLAVRDSLGSGAARPQHRPGRLIARIARIGRCEREGHLCTLLLLRCSPWWRFLAQVRSDRNTRWADSAAACLHASSDLHSLVRASAAPTDAQEMLDLVKPNPGRLIWLRSCSPANWALQLSCFRYPGCRVFVSEHVWRRVAARGHDDNCPGWPPHPSRLPPWLNPCPYPCRPLSTNTSAVWSLICYFGSAKNSDPQISVI